MRRTLEALQQLLDILVRKTGGQPESSRSDLKRLAWRPLLRHQAETKEVVDGLLERRPAAPAFLVQEPGHVVIEGKGGSHIMML